MIETIIIVSAIVCFFVGYGMASKRRLRKLKCWLGWHAPDTAIREDENHIYQRCLYCDRIVMRFERDGAGTIRRVQ